MSDSLRYTQLHQKMTDIRHRIQKESRKEYWKYVEFIISPMQDDNEYSGMKRFWSFIKHRRTDYTGVSPLNLSDGSVTSDATEQANILNKHFFSVFTRDTYHQHDQPSANPPAYPIMDDINITPGGVRHLLENLKVYKSPGPDGITPRVLKELSNPVSSILTVLYRKSYHTGAIPSDWRRANVIPVFKKGSKHNPCNYRPISLTCIACKLMEHIITSSIMAYARNHHILYPLQHGFRDKRSCETQLLGFINDVVNNMHDGLQTDILVMDFSKAFDKVCHRLLINKLEGYGINTKTIEWIRSFLTNRKQQVVLNGVSSKEVDVLSGVPQGSVVGPCLFLLYINDLPENLISKTRLFADDTLAYLTIQSDRDCKVLQNDLDNLARWEKQWLMEFNVEKCEVIHIGRKRHTIRHDYILHDQTLRTADSAKYLGVTVTSNLSWNDHISSITKKANNTLAFLRRNLRLNSSNMKTQAYFGLVRPILEYAASVWDPYTKSNINKIEMIQRRAARYVCNDYKRTSSVTEMLQQLGWLSLEQRRKSLRLIMMYKILNGLVASDGLPTLTAKHRPSRHTNSRALKVPQSKTDYHMYSYFPRSIRQWNTLPEDIVKTSSLETFKQALKN